MVYLITLFGALMMLFSIVMVVNPGYWSRGIVKFSKAPYFHPLEIVSRLVFGVILIAFSGQTLYPAIMSIVGYILVVVGVGLLLTPPSIHRQFAVWSARIFRPIFRPAGMVSFAFSIFVIYASVLGTGKS